MQSKAVSPQSLTYVAEQCAQNLNSLNVSGNQLTGFAGVIKRIAASTFANDRTNLIGRKLHTYATLFLAHANELL